MQITIYSTTTCPYCKMLKDYLSEKNLTFKEKLVDQDDIARDEMASVSGGFLGVPFTLVIKEDGGISGRAVYLGHKRRRWQRNNNRI